MLDLNALHQTLISIDGRGYASYRKLEGSYSLGDIRLAIDHLQVDPYAPPSKMRLILDRQATGLPDDLTNDHLGAVATADFLTRRFAAAIHDTVPPQDRSGGGGNVSIGKPGQTVLERTSVIITGDRVEARIEVGLPARGRRVRGRDAARLLTESVPRIADAALRYQNLNAQALRDHVELYRDQEHLRSMLADRGLVAFLGDGAILPRRAGDSDLPLESASVPFSSPDSLRVRFELPSGRSISGMGVPEGVSVIVGGGYHGKSTVLRAIERGVYPHLGGDGREWVVTRPDAVTVRAEDGRSVTGVDISPFIGDLPSGANTREFSTTNASGSTSQAANLVEALEAGASTLLIDEDTSATNFMIRDNRIRQLIPADREPITPFVERIRPLFHELGASTILVAGGSGAFFDVADQVIMLDAYVPHDVTDQALALADTSAGVSESPVFDAPTSRIPLPDAMSSPGKNKPAKARGRSTIQYGKDTVDLSAVAQLIDVGQTQALAYALDRLSDIIDGHRTVPEAVDELWRNMDRDGLDWLSPFRGHPGILARPRRYEVHAALNRYRRLRLGHNGPVQIAR